MMGRAAIRAVSLAAWVLAVDASAQAPVPLTFWAIRETPPGSVGLRLIGPEHGADVERIESRREPMLPATLEVLLFHRPAPLGRGYCSQLVHRVYLLTIRHEGPQTLADDDALRINNSSEMHSLARAPGCRLSAGQRFVAITPGDAEVAMQTLDNLASAQAIAAAGGRLGMRLRCQDEVERDPDLCRRGAREVFSNLPLNRVCLISRDHDDPQTIEATICTGDSIWMGETIWTIRMRAFGTSRARLSMLWKDPRPF